MAYETIDFKTDGPIARITLNRPDRLNSFTVQMHEELRDRWAAVHGTGVHPAIRERAQQIDQDRVVPIPGVQQSVE